MGSLDNFKVFKDYIKKMVLEDQELQKLVYYPYSDCLDKEDLENPFDVFSEDTAINSENGVHGIILFKRQSDVIMNSEMPSVLISFETTKKGKYISNVYIIIKIICKGTNIQELNDGSSRIYSIKRKFNDFLETANINDIGEFTENSFKELSINSENDAMLLIYKGFGTNAEMHTNKNYQLRKYGRIL